VKKNILLITSDQHHFSCMGYNNPEVKTPNLDRLAAEGMIFDRAYCPNPTCTPSRASIITGAYPSQHGAWALGTKLPEDCHVVGDDFRDAGYRTALIGKAHFQPVQSTPEYPSLEGGSILQDLDFWRSFSDRFYGFDEVELLRNHGNGGGGQHYSIWLEEKGLANWRDYFKPSPDTADGFVWRLPEQYHYSAWIAERANARLEEYKNNGDNFFLWVSHPDPHGPNIGPERWVNMYDPDSITVPAVTAGEHDNNPPHFQLTQQVRPDRSMYREEGGHDCHGIHSHLSKHENAAHEVTTYYGRVSMLDHYIGKTLDKLDELGLGADTLVIFTCPPD